MYKYLIKLNRPVVIDDCYHGAPIKQPVYGFLCPYSEDDPAENAYHKECIELYVSYLAAMHRWSENGGEEFSVVDKEWTDQAGVEYPYEWRAKICQRDRKVLGLDYTLYLVDLDDIDEPFVNCGTDRNLIISPVLMDYLIEIAELPDGEEFDLRNVVLFNHPVWIPKHILWEGETGFCNVYGLATEEHVGREQLEGFLQYLGYLAVIEEVTLNGVSPSGFTADIERDGSIWYNRGKEYPVGSEEMKEECYVCRRKHNYKLCGVAEAVPREDLEDGLRGEYIVSKAIYERLLEICEC